MIEDINEVEEFETDDQQLYEHWKIEVDPDRLRYVLISFFQRRIRIRAVIEFSRLQKPDLSV